MLSVNNVGVLVCVHVHVCIHAVYMWHVCVIHVGCSKVRANWSL